MSRPQLPPRIELADNGYWYVHYYDPEKGPVRESTKEQHAAKAWRAFAKKLNQLADDLDGKGMTPVSAGKAVLVSDVLDLYERKVVEPSVHVGGVMAKDHARNLLRKLRERFGSTLAASMDAEMVAEYIDERRKAGDAPSTTHAVVSKLKTCYKRAFIAKLVPAPLLFDMPGKSQPRQRFLTLDEMKQLFAEAHARRTDHRLSVAEIFCRLALTAPARKEAIRELTWNRVNFVTGLIDFATPEWDALPKKRKIKKRPHVPMSAQLRAYLERAYKERTDEFVVPRNRERKADYKLEWTTIKGVSPHVLRHTWASQKSMHREAMGEIARFMAIDEKTAANVYAHFNPDYLQTTATDLVMDDAGHLAA